MSAIQGLFSAEWFWSYLKWFIVLGVWGVLAVDIYKESRHLKTIQNTHLQVTDLTALTHKLHQRNILILLLIFLLLCAGVLNEQRTATPPLAEVASMPDQLSSPTALPQESTAHATAFEKALSSSPLPFTDITEFNEKDSEQQAYLDWLKRRYEAWLITYYYLQKCGQVDAGDLALIEGSLQQKLGETDADSTVQNNILLAASGSYKEMYADIPCDSEHFASTKSAYEANMQQIKNLNQSATASSSFLNAVAKPTNTH